jgi:hypothetical protein
VKPQCSRTQCRWAAQRWPLTSHPHSVTYSKRFVILANSRKSSGRCVAGIELTGQSLGPWVRPVSERASEELAIEERRYQNGRDVSLLDVVEVQFKAPRPHACQVENHVIDDGYYWVPAGTFEASRLLPVAVNRGPLWVDGYSSYSGENDRVPLPQADQLPSSLLLAAPTKASMLVAPGLKKRQVRMRFSLPPTQYCLTVTDPKLEAEYLSKPDGEYPFSGPVLVCVSLGEPFDGYRYKLAAAVLPI